MSNYPFKTRIPPQSDSDDDDDDEAYRNNLLNKKEEDYQFAAPNYTYPASMQSDIYINQESTNTGEDNFRRYQSSQDEQSSNTDEDEVIYNNNNSNTFETAHSIKTNSAQQSSPDYVSEMNSTLSISKEKSTFLPNIINNITTSLEASVTGNKLNQFYSTITSNNNYDPNQLKSFEVSQILENKEKTQIQILQNDIKKHQKVLTKGKDPSNIRNAILTNLNDLLESFGHLESYHEDNYIKLDKFVEKFEVWENKKYKITSKLREMEKTIEYNHKLIELENENNIISAKIEDLENQILTLKNKRKIIRNEIDSTKSIIESEKSSYLKSIENVEKSEQLAITRLIKDEYLKSEDIGIVTQSPLSNRNVMENLRLAFNKISFNSNETVNIDIVIESLKNQKINANISQNYYKQCIEDFKRIIFVWKVIYETLSSNEKKLLNIISSNDSREESRLRIEKILENNCSLVMDKINIINNQITTVGEIFIKVLLNELNAIKNSLSLINPNSKLFEKINQFNIGTIEKSIIINNSPKYLEKSISPPTKISSSPPQTSYINTFASNLSKNETKFISKYSKLNFNDNKIVKND